MNHDELVQRACKWLKGTRRCFAVLAEAGCYGEFPDAIGWHRQWSILVECKLTRGDFLRDIKKPHRYGGMGQERWYLAPAGVIRPSDLVGPTPMEKWGLIELRGDRCYRVKNVEPEKRLPDLRVSHRELCLVLWNISRLTRSAEMKVAEENA